MEASDLNEVSQIGGTSTFPTNPEEFDSDERISFSQLDNKFLLVHENGTEYEFNEGKNGAEGRWIPVLDEELMEQQQRAYAVQGVDENEPVDAMKRKRKKEYVNGEDEGGRMVKTAKKPKQNLPPKQNTAVWVTGLPLDTTVQEVKEVFTKFGGIIAEEIDSGNPRIKLYTDDAGQHTGDALIVFFKAPAVDNAIRLLDDSIFRYTDAGNSGKIRVQPADSSYKKVQNNKEETGDRPKPKSSMKDKQKIIKKTQKLEARLADWDDDEPSALPDTSSKHDKVVILEHMFTLQELDEDPAAILEIKEDIREECGKLGEVTNVVLFDEEEAGIASVRFANIAAAKACVGVMNGRSFGGQTVVAYVSTGQEQFKKSKKKAEEGEEN